MVLYFREVTSSKGKTIPQNLYDQGAPEMEALLTGLSLEGIQNLGLMYRHYKEIAERLGVKNIFIRHNLKGPDNIEINFGEISLDPVFMQDRSRFYFSPERLEALIRELAQYAPMVVTHRFNDFWRSIQEPYEQTYTVRIPEWIKPEYANSSLPVLQIYVRNDEHPNRKTILDNNKIVIVAGLGNYQGRLLDPSLEHCDGVLLVDEDMVNNPAVAHALDLVVQHLFEKDINPPKLETIG